MLREMIQMMTTTLTLTKKILTQRPLVKRINHHHQGGRKERRLGRKNRHKHVEGNARRKQQERHKQVLLLKRKTMSLWLLLPRKLLSGRWTEEPNPKTRRNGKR